MNGPEIRKKINQNNELIETQNLNMFTLNKKVQVAIAQNKYLRSICNHKFENGYCIYCDAQEEK